MKTPKDELPEGISKKMLFEALLEKDRLGYMGSFIQGLIHNINGPLQNVSMLAEFVTKAQGRIREIGGAGYSDENKEAWNKLCAKQEQRLEQLSGQVTSVVEMLRDFMWLNDVERNESEVDLNLVIRRLIQVFRADLFFKHNVELELRLGENLPLVRIVGCHLISAFVHLFKNAMVAMRGVPKKKLVIESRLDGDKIRLVFEDSGCGFAVERARSFFDPFVSEWPEDSSNARDIRVHHFGLGLFVVRCLLEPYGVIVALKRLDYRTLAIVEIPVKQGGKSLPAF